MILIDGIAPCVREIEIDFPFPDLSRSVAAKTLIEGNRVIGAGIITTILEGILILDKRENLVTRTRAAIKLVDAMGPVIKANGYNDCHAFVRDPTVERFLKRVGFRDSLGGKSLIYFYD